MPIPRRSAEKASKAEAEYGRGSGSVRCYLCAHFEPPSACSKVEGRIRPEDACKYFKKAR